MTYQSFLQSGKRAADHYIGKHFIQKEKKNPILTDGPSKEAKLRSRILKKKAEYKNAHSYIL